MGDEFHTPFKSSQPEEKKRELDTSSCQRMWDTLVRESPLNRLRYLDARLAQGATVDPNRVAELIREVGAKAVLSDPDAIGLVRQLFGERGVIRLRDRARTETDNAQPDVVANMADPLHQRGKK
jgi:hypothetical protein